MARITKQEQQIINQGSSLEDIKARIDRKPLKPAPGLPPAVPVRPPPPFNRDDSEYPYNSGKLFNRQTRQRVPESPNISGNTIRTQSGNIVSVPYKTQDGIICKHIDDMFDSLDFWNLSGAGYQSCQGHDCCNVVMTQVATGTCGRSPHFKKRLSQDGKKYISIYDTDDPMVTGDYNLNEYYKYRPWICVPPPGFIVGIDGDWHYMGIDSVHGTVIPVAPPCEHTQVGQALEVCGLSRNMCVDNNACGCLEPYAENYDEFALYQCANVYGYDSCCVYPDAGCTDPQACNYNPEVEEDDDSCEYPIPGCNCEGVCDEENPEPPEEGAVICEYCDEGCAPQYETYDHCMQRCQAANPDADVGCEVNPCICKYCTGCKDEDACNYVDNCGGMCCEYIYYPEWGCLDAQCIRSCDAGVMSDDCLYGDHSPGNESCCVYCTQSPFGNIPCNVFTCEGDCVQCCNGCDQILDACGECVDDPKCDCCGDQGGGEKWSGEDCEIIRCNSTECTNVPNFLLGENWPCIPSNPCGAEIDWARPLTYRNRYCINTNVSDCSCDYCPTHDVNQDCCAHYECSDPTSGDGFTVGPQPYLDPGYCVGTYACNDWLETHNCPDLDIPSCGSGQ
jgi:hypothetical protein